MESADGSAPAASCRFSTALSARMDPDDLREGHFCLPEVRCRVKFWRYVNEFSSVPSVNIRPMRVRGLPVPNTMTFAPIGVRL